MLGDYESSKLYTSEYLWLHFPEKILKTRRAKQGVYFFHWNVGLRGKMKGEVLANSIYVRGASLSPTRFAIGQVI